MRRAASWVGAITAVFVLGTASSARAQFDEPIGLFVVDLRGSISPYGQDPNLAFNRGYDPSVTPGVGLGFEAGAHLYFYRWRVITFGIGGSVHASLGDRSASEIDPDPDGPTLRKTLTAVSPQLSFSTLR